MHSHGNEDAAYAHTLHYAATPPQLSHRHGDKADDDDVIARAAVNTSMHSSNSSNSSNERSGDAMYASITQLERDLLYADAARRGVVAADTFRAIVQRHGGTAAQAAALTRQFAHRTRPALPQDDCQGHNNGSTSCCSSSSKSRSSSRCGRADDVVDGVNYVYLLAHMRALLDDSDDEGGGGADDAQCAHDVHDVETFAADDTDDANTSNTTSEKKERRSEAEDVYVSLRTVYRHLAHDARDGVVTLRSVTAALQVRGVAVSVWQLAAIAEAIGLCNTHVTHVNEEDDNDKDKDDEEERDGDVVLDAASFCLLVSRLPAATIAHMRRASLWRPQATTTTHALCSNKHNTQMTKKDTCNDDDDDDSEVASVAEVSVSPATPPPSSSASSPTRQSPQQQPAETATLHAHNEHDSHKDNNNKKNSDVDAVATAPLCVLPIACAAALRGQSARLLSACMRADVAQRGVVTATQLAHALRCVCASLTDDEVHSIVQQSSSSTNSSSSSNNKSNKDSDEDETASCAYLPLVHALVEVECHDTARPPLSAQTPQAHDDDDDQQSNTAAHGHTPLATTTTTTTMTRAERMRERRVLQRELSHAVRGSWADLHNALLAYDDAQTGYMDAATLRTALDTLFVRCTGRAARPWLLQRCLTLAHAPLARVAADSSVAQDSSSAARRRDGQGIRRGVAALPSALSCAEAAACERARQTPPKLWAILYDYRYLLDELEP